MIAWALSSCSSIKTVVYELTSPLLEEHSFIKIVLIADLHGTIYGNDQTILIDKIKNENPDLIILCGDIIDEVYPITGARLLLSGICDLAPIYYVTGNHEYYTERIKEIRYELEYYKVIILSDRYVQIKINNNEIILAGIEDPDKALFETPDYDQEEIMEDVFRELDDIQLYKILIAHRPELIELYKKYSFDLILSGHTHGGQIRFFGSKMGLYAPNQGLFPKYSGGLYKHALSKTHGSLETHKGVTHIISRGLSVNRLPRIFNPPELVVVIIKPEY